MKFQKFDSGPLTGEENMAIDADALAAADGGRLPAPRLRLFQWTRPVVTYGYLLDPEKVRRWAEGDIVKRPTGGGAVRHQTTDLSLSLLWRRGGIGPPSKPKTCYKLIHRWLMNALTQTDRQAYELHVNQNGRCEAEEGPRFSACYDRPVCNDVMKDGRKIIGGALRLTKHSVLYQGNIRSGGRPVELKTILISSVDDAFFSRPLSTFSTVA